MVRKLLLFLLGCLTCAAAKDRELYITHVTVIDTETGAENADRTVVISGETIAEVRDSSVAPPAGARVIDGTGKFLIPGLWDMHVHGASDERASWSDRLYIANGITGVRDMWGPENANKFREHYAREKDPAPRLYLASPIIDGNPPVWPTSVVVNNPEQARAVVDKYKSNGADFIKVYARLTRDEYFAIAEESRKHQIPFAGHVPLVVTAREASAAGQRSIEHLNDLALSTSGREAELRQRWPVRNPQRDPILLEAARSYDEGHAQQLFAEFKKNQTWQVPTLTVLRSMSRLNDEQFTRDPRLRYMPPDWRNRNPLSGPRFRDWTAADFARLRELFEYDKKLAGMMFRAGVPMLAGTDAQNPYCMPGFSLHDELALLVESGVTPLAALQMATRNPAVFMNATDRYGSVAPGKSADLVLLDADPLQDIHNTTRIDEVFFGGRELDQTALKRLLR